MVKLVDQGFFRVNQLVDDLHERRDLRGTRLVDLLKDLAVPETFLVVVDDLVVPNADAGVTVLEELVGVVPQPLAGLHGHPPEVEGIAGAIVRHLEVRREGLRRSAHDVMLPTRRLLSQSNGAFPITSGK
jgi:sulfur carrier protein ThiS